MSKLNPIGAAARLTESVSNPDLVTCAFCGHTFAPAESRSACQSCPLHPGGKECGWLRCPNCGYESPREAAWLRGVRKFFGTRAKEAPACPDQQAGGQPRPLSELPPGESGRVAYLATKDKRKLQKLMAFGILPGMPVRVLQRSPSFVFQVGQTQLAVDQGIAMDIFVGGE